MLSPTVELQRSVGTVRLNFARRDTQTRISALYQQGCYKARIPEAQAAEAILINTAGGMTDGDILDAEVTWQPGAAAVVTTQAAERIYRSRAGMATVRNQLTAHAGASACWFPQETIVFDRAALARSMRVDLAPDARLLAAESIVFGRRAMGESLRDGYVADNWRIHIDGQLVFADSIRLRTDSRLSLGNMLERPAVTNKARAVATLVYTGPDATAACNTARQLLGETHVTGGASLLGPLLVVRLAARDGMAMRALVVALYEALWKQTLPRTWNC